MKTFIILLLLAHLACFSQTNKINCDTYVVDVDSDGTDDFIKVVNKRTIFAYKSDYLMTPILYKKISFDKDIINIISGRFLKNDNTNQNIFIVITYDYFYFLKYDKSTYNLLEFSKQKNLDFEEGDNIVVGNFDDDNEDEILVKTIGYDPIFYEMNHRKKLINIPETKIGLGNLSRMHFYKKVIYGISNKKKNRTDLVILDEKTKQIHLYGSALEKGKYVFWFAFTTKGNMFENIEDVLPANIDGEKDGLIIRQKDRTYKLLALEYNNGNLKIISEVDTGQLPIKTGKAFMVKHKDKRKKRDNVFFVQNNYITLTGAAYDREAKKKTYWWAYTNDKHCKR